MAAEKETFDEKLDRLWRDAVLPLVGADKFLENKYGSIITLLKSQSDLIRKATSMEELWYDFYLMNRVWQTLSNDLMADLVCEIEKCHKLHAKKDAICIDRKLLKKCLCWFIIEDDLFDDADIVTVSMPRKLAEKTLLALDALDVGEVQAMFAPVGQGRHKEPFSWDKARLAACEHVSFLVGRGKTKAKAREAVSEVTLIGDETLRQWERLFKKRTDHAWDLRIAEFAGRPESSGASSDPAMRIFRVASVRKRLDGDALDIFGKHYRAKFGGRHHRQ